MMSGALPVARSQQEALKKAMRVCPTCNETFADDLKFCDLDGTPLKGAGGPSGSGRLWSLLGIVLLVGALAISAAMIFFQPRGPVAQGPRPQPAEATPQRPAPNVETDRAVPSSELTATAPGSQLPQIEAGSQKMKPAMNQLPAGPLPDPKAAAIAAEAPTEKPDSEAKPITALPSESERSLKTAAASDSSAGKDRLVTSDTSAPATASTEPKKEANSRTTKEAGQDPAKADDKKKGGFLKVFKKIFGGKPN